MNSESASARAAHTCTCRDACTPCWTTQVSAADTLRPPCSCRRWDDGPQVTHSSNMNNYLDKRNIYSLCEWTGQVISPWPIKTIHSIHAKDGNEDTPRALLSTQIRLGYARALVQPRSHKDICRARKAHWHWYNRCGTQASRAARIQRMTRTPRSPRGHPDRHVATELTCIQKESARNTCCAQEIQKVWLAGWVRFRTTSNTAHPQIATWPPRSPRGHRFKMYSDSATASSGWPYDTA